MIAHLPTLMLVVGYAVFWLELYVFKLPGGVTTPLAWSLWLILCFYLFLKNKEVLSVPVKEMLVCWQEQKIGTKVYLAAGGIISIFVLLCALYAALLPPHLIQESDVLNYHYTLPRQHLILNSFQHIRWSSADLFLLPLQFALSPYWFATALPNKMPQFIFLIGIIAMVASLIKHFGANKFSTVVLGVLAVIGSHNVGIQMGTAMLDLVICYLFLAFVDSFLKGNMFLAAIEFSFFLWSKSFVPFQMALIMAAMFLLFRVLKIFNFRTLTGGFSQNIVPLETGKLKRFLVGAVVFSIFIGGPFAGKSLYYSGTPLYPLGAGLAKISGNSDATTTRQSLRKAAEAYAAYKDSYGYGRSFEDFVRHFWLIAVPDEGVNNKFDYPVGLPYLLFIGPFIYFLYRCLRQKVFPVIPVFVVAYWLLWWAGTQQTRFLYIPVILMYITVLVELKNISFFLKGAVFLALLLNALSVFRTHYHDFGTEPLKLLRQEDLGLVAQSESYRSNNKTGYVDLPVGEVAFAQFPVNVTQGKLPFIISY